MAGREVGLARFVEPEVGNEMQFCPIRNLPICRDGRVRTLPGFHLLSLAAGREALANGFYSAFGKRFPCKDLEYLHPEDKIFICAEDNRAFLNQMSMQYHRYINHELGERKAERRRMRERAAERRQARQQPKRAAPAAIAPVPAAGAAINDPYADAEATAAAAAPKVAPAATGARTTAPATSTAGGDAAASDDPYGGAGATEPEQLLAREAPAAASPSPAAASPPTRAAATAAPTPAAAAASAPAVATPAAPAVPAAAAALSAKRPQPEDDGDDLYGDMGEGEAKRAKSTSAYASAVDSMLDDDFGEEDD